MHERHRVAALAALTCAFTAAFVAAGCTPGYVRSDELERNEQGPSACESRCRELGMRMGALVLVSNDMPACVCEPVRADGFGSSATSGGAGAAGGHVAIAIAAAAAAQQQQVTRQQQAAAAAAAATHR